MVKLGCSFSGKPGKDPGDQDGAAMDSVPLISPLDVSQLQPPLPDQVVIKTQTEYQLSSPDQQKKFPDLEGQRLNCSHPEEGRRWTVSKAFHSPIVRSARAPHPGLMFQSAALVTAHAPTVGSHLGGLLPTARMIAFAMALLGCVLIMYKAIWYDQFTCPDGFLLRHKICTPLTLEMYYTEMDPERHRSILAAIGAYPLSRKHGTETPAVWGDGYRAAKEERKGPTQAGAATATEPPGKPSAKAEKEAARKAAGSAAPPLAQ
ncbi:neuron-specific vesicular protein calcyon isoform X1 [Pongo abelii]|uniref:neuron-specific vesicular protein calcyon isoform X1 n=1 Tax=Pongo abelii TaxID=9601 RepID=UPI0023E7EE64|nr:neuron-specific vesicular protein calcyon isoform X1 [Pongo abelii]